MRIPTSAPLRTSAVLKHVLNRGLHAPTKSSRSSAGSVRWRRSRKGKISTVTSCLDSIHSGARREQGGLTVRPRILRPRGGPGWGRLSSGLGEGCGTRPVYDPQSSSASESWTGGTAITARVASKASTHALIAKDVARAGHPSREPALGLRRGERVFIGSSFQWVTKWHSRDGSFAVASGARRWFRSRDTYSPGTWSDQEARTYARPRPERRPWLQSTAQQRFTWRCLCLWAWCGGSQDVLRLDRQHTQLCKPSAAIARSLSRSVT